MHDLHIWKAQIKHFFTRAHIHIFTFKFSFPIFPIDVFKYKILISIINQIQFNFLSRILQRKQSLVQLSSTVTTKNLNTSKHQATKSP